MLCQPLDNGCKGDPRERAPGVLRRSFGPAAERPLGADHRRRVREGQVLDEGGAVEHHASRPRGLAQEEEVVHEGGHGAVQLDGVFGQLEVVERLQLVEPRL
eukprot:9896255-Lingulodinium_polyedra.AAC.1